MENEYYYEVESTEDISKALKEAESAGVTLNYFNAVFLLRGEAGRPISVDTSLRNLYVVARGPAPVRASGEALVVAEESAIVYATDSSAVVARGHATVYAYDQALVDAYDDASVLVFSDDVDLDVFDRAKVYLTPSGTRRPEAE